MALRTMAPVFLRRDDDRVFERLYERHVSDVYRYAAAMLGTGADAEDVTQTTFLNAYRAFKGGTRPEKPQSWLIAIAHNVCRQRFRQAQRRPHEVAFDERAGVGETHDDVGAPTAEDLRRALSQLPPNQRAALVMRELEGSSYNEIADVLGISVSALETLLFRARRALREQLEEQITCQEAALAINKQLDGRLTLRERRALRAHLRACSECHSLAQSQRAQRRALKALVLIPLPATMSHWIGNQTAAAATGAGAAGGLTAVGATAGGGGTVGASSIALGGVAAKVAAVVAAGVVVGGGTYEGVKHVARPTARTARPTAAHVQATSASATLTVGTVRASVATREREARAATGSQARTKARAARHSRSKSAAGRAPVTPPGQTVKTLAHTPRALRASHPGSAAKATRAATPASTAHAHNGVQAHRKTRAHRAHTARTRAKPKATDSTPAVNARGQLKKGDAGSAGAATPAP